MRGPGQLGWRSVGLDWREVVPLAKMLYCLCSPHIQLISGSALNRFLKAGYRPASWALCCHLREEKRQMWVKNTRLDGGKLILKEENCWREQIRENNERKGQGREKSRQLSGEAGHVCQSMAQRRHLQCQASHGELHLQQRENEGSALQELRLGTAKGYLYTNSEGFWGRGRQDLWGRALVFIACEKTKATRGAHLAVISAF